MRKGLVFLFVVALSVAPVALGHAQEATPSAGQANAAATPPAAKNAPATSGRADAAESRYRAWVDREHAQDAAVFQSEKAKVEDKYKGYVRPPHEKKATASPKTSQKTGD